MATHRIAMLLFCMLAASAGVSAFDQDIKERPPGISRYGPEPRVPAATVDKQTAALLESLVAELARLRRSIDELAGSMESFQEGAAADLRSENRRLRRALSLRGLPGEDPIPALPQPGGGRDGKILAEMGLFHDKTLGQEEPEPFSFRIVQEWGRSPEDVAQSGLNAPSLKGMIIEVPSGSRDEDLIALGRKLRTEFTEYDNVNVEVFNNFTSARARADGHTVDPDHRVLNVSKHAASGRDVILLVRGETVTTVPLEAHRPAETPIP